LKKRLTALLCTAVILFAAVLPRAAASTPTIYLLAANDKMCDLPGGLLPVAVNGVIYVPYSLFDKSATGVDLGVYYGLAPDRGPILSLYSLSGRLVFTVNMGQCVDGQDNPMNFRAVTRNGAVYVPAAAVCNFFGLQYSFLPTVDRGTLIRITNGSQSLSDSVFLSSATLSMTYRYNNILKSMEPVVSPTSAPVSTPAVPSASSAPGEKDNKSGVWVYLSVDASQAEESLLAALSGTSGHALLLFSPDRLSAQSGLIRQAVASGFSIGLKVEGTEKEVQEQLARGNELLTHIARIRTRIVSAPASLTKTLDAAGWSCWTANVTGANASALLRSLDSKRTAARLALPATPSVISRVLAQVRTDGYTLRQPLETEL
jgi:hypothetical protein